MGVLQTTLDANFKPSAQVTIKCRIASFHSRLMQTAVKTEHFLGIYKQLRIYNFFLIDFAFFPQNILSGMLLLRSITST